jgi:hypothetical protein
MAKPTRVVTVDARTIRKMFNEDRIEDGVRRGAYVEHVERQSQPAPMRAGFPVCTSSGTARIADSPGGRRAKVHYYRLPDGTIGASGRRDPKAYLKDGVLYVIRT